MAVKYSGGWVWVVSGQRHGRWVVADGTDQSAAWRKYCKKAIAAAK